MPQEYEVRPERSAFVTYRFVVRFLYSLVFFLVVYVLANVFFSVSAIYFVVAFFLLKALSYYSLSVQYEKERYVFFPGKIVRRSGGIFSDREAELVVRNITHISLRLPFVENKLFGTGSIIVESAGSAIAEIHLSSLDTPEQLYEYVEKVMKTNGFKLSKSKLVQEERPSSLGVFFEVFKNFVVTVFSVGFIAFWIGGEFGDKAVDFLISNVGAISLLFFLFLAGLFVRAIFSFLDLKERVYKVYTDTITYSEGFLSKNYSFVPVENLSDSAVSQSFVDKLFGLYDVKVSCQGSNQEILFGNIRNGPQFEETIDALIPQAKALAREGNDQRVVQVKTGQRVEKKVSAAPVSTAFTAEFKMDEKRTIVPLLIALPVCIILFPLLFAWGIILAAQVIKMGATKYIVKRESVEQRYNFLSQKNVEFSNDKITGVVFKENFVDSWFKTCSIQFWSIGSKESITFSNIKKTPELYDSILAKAGIKSGKQLYTMDSIFGFFEFFKASVFSTSVFAAVVVWLMYATIQYHAVFSIGIILFLFCYGATIAYKFLYYSKSKMVFYEKYVFFMRGIFFREKYYARHDNIKDLITVRYPWSREGSVTFDIAGEHTQQDGKNQSTVSNSFRINYVPEISVKNELVDYIITQEPTIQKIRQLEESGGKYSKTLLVSKPDVANSLVVLTIVSIIFFPFIALLPITIPLIIWIIKARSYEIQQDRIIARSGIVYKKQVSILFDKVDNINYGQGMLNKMFKNGYITVSTTGSSDVELEISDIEKFKEFYDVLKKKY